MRVTVEGIVQSVEKPVGDGPGKVWLLQTGHGRPVVCEVNYWPAKGDKPGATQKPGEIGKPVIVKGIARGNKYGVTLTAD